MRVRWILLLATVGALWTLPLSAGAFPGKVEPESRLGAAREELGEPAPPPTRFGLPAGELQVTPTQVLAARVGQKVRFTVTLDRAVAAATLHVTLPRRWGEIPASRLPAVRGPALGRRAGGRAHLRRSGRDVELRLDDASRGASASFEITDGGIPAGTYALRFRWVDAAGRTTRAGTARIAFLAPTREALTTGLAAPGIAGNVTNDSLEESETFIATPPGNKDRIAVGVNWPNASMASWLSDDGGQTWTSRTLPQTIDAPGKASPETGNICCDPMMAADARGNVWFGGLTFDPPGSVPGRIIVNRFAPGTNTLQAQTTGLPARTADQDKPMMTVDNGPLSPTFGRLYVVWNELTTQGAINLVISQCDSRANPTGDAAWCDNADHWSTPASVTPAGGSYIYGDVAVGPDGRVYVTWWDFSNTNAIRGDVCNPASQNCAAASGWGTPQTIAVLDSTGGNPVPFACPILAQPGGRAAPASNIDVDHSGGAENGRVYVSWSDLRPGSGTTRCADGATPAATHLTWDSFAASAAAGALPGGASPSASVGTRLIADGEGGGQANSDDWFTWLAVDQTTGLAWADLYSTRDIASRQKTNFYARSVTPSGGTLVLGPLTKVSSGASDYSGAPCCNFGNDYGDYTGMDATSGRAYPVWSDNSSGGGDGEAFAFVAQPATSQSPTPVTGTGSGAGQRTGMLNGTLNPHGLQTTYHFEYSTGLGYGTSTPDQTLAAGGTAQPVTAALTGLAPGTTFHYRLVASNASGAAAGADGTLTTAPALAPAATTGVASGVGPAGATLNGTVNPKLDPTTYHFEYGTTASYGTLTSDQAAGAGSADVSASAAISSLQPATTYHFRVVATNGTGTTQGGDQTFTTASAPTVVTGAANPIGVTTATVAGTVNPHGLTTTYHFEYGTTTAYGSSTSDQGAGSGSSAVSVSASLSGLTGDTTYHYRLVATNSAGTTNGSDATFDTAPPPPTATTGSATSPTASGATLNGTVNPNGQATTYHFEYGTTTSYGSSTTGGSAGSGTSGVAVADPVSGLNSATTYHFRVVAESAGGTTPGTDHTFTTAPPPPGATTGSASGVAQRAATINGTVNPNGRTTTYQFEYGTTALYGSTTAAQGAGSGITGQAVSAGLGNLSPGTQYHYRLVATSDGGTMQGSDQTFTTAPALAPGASTDPATGVGTTTVTLHATVDPNLDPTTYHFEYGTASGAYDQQTSTASAGAGDSGVAVAANVSALSPGTQYFFRVVAANGTGTVAGGELTFTTDTPPPVPEPPAVTTGAATGVTDAAATLNGTVDPKGQSTTYTFEYGTAPGVYTAHVDGAAPVTGSSAQAVSAPVNGLSPSTTYYARLSATNPAGTTHDGEQSFTTDAAPPPPPPGPSATTLAATEVGQTGATLHGTVANATEYRFEYGVGGQLDSATAFVPTGSSAVSAIVSGLAPGTTYSFRAVAKNASNDTAAGQTLQFTTAAATPAPQPPPADSGGSGTPGGGSAPGGGAAPPSGEEATPVTPSFSVSLASRRPAGAARRGLMVKARCRAACRLLARLYLDGRTASRLGLVRRSRVLLVATGRAEGAADEPAEISLRLSRRAARAVRDARVVTFTLRVKAVDATGKRSRTRGFRATLRRRGRSTKLVPLALAPAA